MELISLGTLNGKEIACMMDVEPDPEGFLEYVLEHNIPLADWDAEPGIRNQKRRQRVESWRQTGWEHLNVGFPFTLGNGIRRERT